MSTEIRRGKEVKTHECEQLMPMMELGSIGNYPVADFVEHGDAISYIYYNEKDNLWVATNDEYSVAINFCPFCGEKLEIN